jgi:hypothetical protein
MEIDAIIIKEKTISEKSRLHLRTSSQTSERENSNGFGREFKWRTHSRVANLSRSLRDNAVQGNLLVGSQRGRCMEWAEENHFKCLNSTNAAREAGNNCCCAILQWDLA